MTFSGLASRAVATSKYSSRQGNGINQLIIHHTAGGTNEGNLKLLSVGDREVSTTYCLFTTGELVGIVPEEYRQWTTGWQGDKDAVTVETVNTSGAPEWRVSDAQVEKLAQLAADLCKRYGWGTVDQGRVDGHRDYMATACPGDYLYGLIDYIIARANEIRGGSTPPPSGVVQGSVAELAAAVIRGDYGNGQERKDRLGSRYGEVQAEVDRIKAAENQQAQAPQSIDIEGLARAVIRGDYGNGQERRDKLKGNFDVVQARVNEILDADSADNPTYTVQPGDSLSGIASRLRYNGGWEALYNKNRAVVGANPNRIFAGQVLSL